MKSHEFAKHLSTMAKILKSGPNVELEDIDIRNSFELPSNNAHVNNEDIPQALSMLVGLNNVGKQQWLTLIDEFGFDIPIRQRDANRDIFGKLLKYLADNPNERERLVHKKSKKPISASSELTDALNILLK